MFSIIVIIVFVLFLLSIILLVAVGLCVGIAYLMTYFIPTLELSSVLVPVAILETAVIIALGTIFKELASESIKSTYLPFPDYSDDEEYHEEDEPEPEPPTVTKNRPYPIKKKRR